MTMVNNVIAVVNYVIATGPSPLNFVIADTWPGTVASVGMGEGCRPIPTRLLGGGPSLSLALHVATERVSLRRDRNSRRAMAGYLRPGRAGRTNGHPRSARWPAR